MIVGTHSSMSIVTQLLNVRNVEAWIWLMNLKEGSMTGEILRELKIQTGVCSRLFR